MLGADRKKLSYHVFHKAETFDVCKGGFHSESDSLDVVADYDTYYRYYEDNRRFLWGTSFGKARKYGQKEHIHMEIAVDEAKEMYVVKRLEREKEAVL